MKSNCHEYDFSMEFLLLQVVPKHLLESGEQYIVGSPFNFVFVRVSDKTQNKCSKDSSIQIYN